MRQAIDDRRKSAAEIRKQIDSKATCRLDGCNSPLTQMTGPGSNKLCRKHQLYLREYKGGMGRLDRPHTFHRSWICSGCGWDAWNDPIYQGLSEDEKSIAIRMVMHGHHNEERKADGGSDSVENIVGLCDRCHAIRTTLNKDYLANRESTNRLLKNQ